MTETHEKRAIKLRSTEWQRLEQLAEETNSRPRDGVNARRISVAELIRRIAKGDFTLTETAPYANTVELTPEMEAEWERQRQEWQRRRESTTRTAEELRPAGPYTQLSMIELEAA